MSYYIGEIVKLRAEFVNAHKKGDYIEAYVAAEKIIKKYEENNDISSMDFASDIYNLGVVSDDINNYTVAIDCYRKSAKIRKENNPKSNEYADTISNLAVDLALTGKRKEALDLFKEVITIREKNIGTSHNDYILTLYNIGNLYEDMKDYDKAIEYLRRAQVKAQRKNSFLKNDYADIFSSLARCYERKGNYKESIKNYSSAIETVELNLNTDTFYYMSMLVAASNICEKAKFYDKALKYSQKAIAIREKIMEKTHLDYITSLNSICAIYTKMENYKKALEIHEEVLNLVKGMLGENHSFYADALNNIGIDYSNMGKFDEALKYHNMALENKKNIMGDDSTNIAVTYISLGNVYSKMKDKDNALKAYKKALEIRKNYYGEGNIYYIEVLNAIGKFYSDMGEYRNASDYYTKAMMLRSAIAEKTSSGYVKNLIEMTDNFSKEGKKKQALDIINDGINIRKKIYGEKHPKYADALFAKAEILIRGKDYDEARKILEDVVLIREEMIGSSSVDYREALSLYGDSCRLSGEYDEAINSYNRSIELNTEENYKDKKKANEEKLKIALALFGKGDIKKGNMYFRKAMNAYDRDKIERDDFFYESIIECAKYNIKNKHFEQAALILENIESICNEFYKDNKEKTAELKMIKASLLYESNDYEKAVDIINEILNYDGFEFENNNLAVTKLYIMLSKIYAEKNDKENELYNLLKAEKIAENEDYIFVLKRLGDIYFKENEYDKSLKYFELAKKFIEDKNKTDISDYIYILDLMGDIYKIKNDTENMVNMYDYSLRLRKKSEIKDEIYINENITLGEIFAEKDDNKALEYLSEAAVVMNEINGEDKKYAFVLMSIGKIYEKDNKLEEALGMFKKASDVFKIRAGEKSIEYLKAIGKVADIEYTNGDTKSAYDIYEKLYEISIKEGKSEIFDKVRRENLSAMYKANKEYKKLIKFKFKR